MYPQGRIVQRLAQLYDELVEYAAVMGDHNKKLADYEVSSSRDSPWAILPRGHAHTRMHASMTPYEDPTKGHCNLNL